MSLDAIDHKLTTSTTDENGVITWSNPAVKETINSKGEVFNQYGEKRAKSVLGKYSITICGLNYGYPASFNSIYSRMVLGVKLRSNTLKKKSDEVGYLPENMEVISTTKAYLAGKNFKTKGNVLHPKSKPIHKQQTPKQEIMELENTVENTNTIGTLFYTEYKAINEHITEDGAVFPTKELAEWHQEKVSKGKGNAQVVLDYNGGYVLAEQIYFQEVVYNRTKPYTNFINVLNNNQGIVSNVQEEHCVFDQLDKHSGLSPVQLKLFGLDKVINLPCTKLQAEKINTSLNKYSEAFSKLEDEHKTLKDLLKQVS